MELNKRTPESAANISPPDTPPGRTPQSSDFWDGLSPMIVKELRQSLRSRAFVFSFLLLQGLFVLSVLIRMASGSFGSESDKVFWILSGAVLAFIIPLGGLSSVRREIDEKTLELVLLTRLGAWKIITGKWLSILTLVILLSVTALPYLVLRHFVGSVELTADLKSLGWLVLASAGLSAFAVSVSPYLSRAGRIVMIVVCLIGIPNGVTAFGYFFFRGGSVPSPSGRLEVLLFIVALTLGAIILVLLAFEIGARKIAPMAENHSARVRALIWLLLIVETLCAGTEEIRQAQFLISAFIASPFLVGMLLEEISPAGGSYRPFVRRRIFGKLAGWFFYPGWPSGTLWSVATCAAIVLVAPVVCPAVLTNDMRVNAAIASACAAVFAPVAVIRALPFKKGAVVTLFLIHAIMSCISIPISILRAMEKSDFTWITTVMPTAQFICLATGAVPPHMIGTHLTIAVIVALVSVVCLILAAVRGFRTRILPLVVRAAEGEDRLRTAAKSSVA